MTSPLAKARQYQARKRRRAMLEVKKAPWMRNTENYTHIRGVYQEVRSEWYFRSPQPPKGEKRQRVYYKTLADALEQVNPQSATAMEMYVYQMIREGS